MLVECRYRLGEHEGDDVRHFSFLTETELASLFLVRPSGLRPRQRTRRT